MTSIIPYWTAHPAWANNQMVAGANVAAQRLEEAMAMIQVCVVACVAGMALGLTATDSAATDWPTRPMRFIVPVGAGSTADIIPRVVAEQLALQLGQNVVVENKPGAGGTIGSSFVAKAEPNGYTALVHSQAHTIAPALYSNLNYHPANDFAAVVPLGVSPVVLVVSPSRGIRTIADFVGAAKSRPGAVNFSSVGIGTATHMSAERFRSSAGIQATHVPFKGGAEAMLEVIAGRMDFFFGPVGLVLPHVREGKLVPLVVNSTKRSSLLSDVPTTAEAGYTDAEYPIWFGIFMPAKTPHDIVGKLNRETLKAIRTPKVSEKLASLGVDSLIMEPKLFAALVEREIALNANLVRTIGLKPE